MESSGQERVRHFFVGAVQCLRCSEITENIGAICAAFPQHDHCTSGRRRKHEWQEGDGEKDVIEGCLSTSQEWLGGSHLLCLFPGPSFPGPSNSSQNLLGFSIDIHSLGGQFHKEALLSLSV